MLATTRQAQRKASSFADDAAQEMREHSLKAVGAAIVATRTTIHHTEEDDHRPKVTPRVHHELERRTFLRNMAIFRLVHETQDADGKGALDIGACMMLHREIKTVWRVCDRRDTDKLGLHEVDRLLESHFPELYDKTAVHRACSFATEGAKRRRPSLPCIFEHILLRR